MSRKAWWPIRVLSLAIVAIGMVLGSCSSILGTEDYKDSTTELCDLLNACYKYKNCESRIGSRLDNANATDRTLWLASLSDKACLEQCSSARRCLNIKPVCTDFGKSCDRKEDCCGFLGGKAECEGGSCCRAKGAQCLKETDCCPGTICDPRTNTCGGVTCSAVGQLCKNDFDCCTNICRDNLCKEGICTPIGSACNADTDTCCDNSECLDGVCGFAPTCRTAEEKCLVDAPPGTAESCCDPLTCVPYGTENDGPVGICRESQCLPENLPCDVGPCCPDLACDPYKHLCGQRCGAPGNSCQNDWECCSNACKGASATGGTGICDCSLGACVGNDDCCSGACIKGACAPQCNAPDPSCHDECTKGAPLDGKLCLPDGVTPLENTICAADVDPYCCCVEWDDLCIDEAVKTYGSSICSL